MFINCACRRTRKTERFFYKYDLNAMNICVCTSCLWLCGVVVGFVSLVIGCTRWRNSVYILIFVVFCVYVNSHVLLDHQWCKVLNDMVSKTNKYMYDKTRKVNRCMTKNRNVQIHLWQNQSSPNKCMTKPERPNTFTIKP